MSFNDDNLKRLLREYYRPATASSDFKEKLHKLVSESDSEAADMHPFRSWLKPLIWGTIGIVCAALIASGIIFFPRGQNSEIASIITTTTTTTLPSSTTTPTGIQTTLPSSTATTPASTQATTTTPVAIAKGTLEIRVTDAPPQYNVTAINVLLSDIRVNQNENENADAEWVVVYEGPVAFDLLKLKEQGYAEILGQAQLDIGHYSQIRMDVEFVSAVIDSQTVDTGVDVPSGVLRLVASFDIRENKVTVLTIDFDAGQSLVFTGQGKINFKPVVTLTVEYPD